LTYSVPDWLMEVEYEIGAMWNKVTDWEALARICVATLTNLAPELNNPRLSVSVIYTSDAQVQTLNHQWRSRDQPTNVLSFPMLSRSELLSLPPEGPPELLGDIALAHETCAREAAKKGVPLDHHAAHLLVHGLLHLAGHDHETGPEDAEAMELLEIKALALMGIGNPYEVLD